MKIISLERGGFELQNRALFYCLRSVLKRNIKLKIKNTLFVNEKIKIDMIFERGANSTKCSTVL